MKTSSVTKLINIKHYLLGFIALLFSGSLLADTIEITVNWPAYAGENNVVLQYNDGSGWVDVFNFCTAQETGPNPCPNGTGNLVYTNQSASTVVSDVGDYRAMIYDIGSGGPGDGWDTSSAGMVVTRDGVEVYSQTRSTATEIQSADSNGEPTGILFSITAPPPPTDCGTSNTSGFASSGVGAYRPLIFWLEWGCGSTTTFTSGGVYQKVWQISPGITFEGTLTVNSITTGAIIPYSSGDWQGDQLVDLYAHPDPINTALKNNTDAADFALTFDFVLKVNGVAVPAVIVSAPAEDLDSNGVTTEIQTLTTNGAAWELLEIPAGAPYANNTNLDLFYPNPDNKTIELQDRPPNAEKSTIIIASENATQIIANVQGGGSEAIAFGVFLGLDYGDAPASYGSAAHYDILRPLSSSKPSSYTDATTLTASTITYDPVRLGSANTDGEDSPKSSTNATGDDTDNTDDEDGVVVPLSNLNSAVTDYSLTVTCGDTQKVVGWIDWAIDGNFAQASDKSAETNCSGGSATLVWSGIPALTTGTTFLRVRTSSSAGVSSPTDAVVSGEAEDYQITITPAADLAVTKTSLTGNYTPGGADTYTIIVTNNGPDDVTGVTISDTLPSGATLTAAWTCTATGTSSCSPASGGTVGGNSVSLTADIKNGETVTITVPVIYSTNPGAY